MRSNRPGAARRLYKSAEDAIGPRLPFAVRDLWRRLIGRPPLARPSSLPSDPVAREAPPPPGTFDVVCFPIIAWSFRFQRPQHLMRELGRREHRVFWVDPDAVKDGVGEGLGAPLETHLFPVRIAGPRPRDPFRDTLEPEDVDSLLPRLAALERDQGLVAPVAVVQLPFWAPLAARAAEELGWRIVYDCMDDHSAFSTNDAAMVENEDRLLRESDLVVTTSARLHERARGHAKRIVSIPNACDPQHFSPRSSAPARPAALQGIPSPIIGYVGAISEWFDFDLLRHAVRTRPDWSFVLVGSTWGADEHDDLAAAPNVHFLGEQPYDDVPALVHQFDVACIPFRRTPLIEATDPVKLYEYQAAEKPVVASRLPELERVADQISLVDDAEAFTRAVERELALDDEDRRARRAAFARANTWADRAQALDESMEALFPTASVCIVTWNNLALTRACLDSVLADRTWPNLEVIVVDNASADGTPDYLNELAATEGRVQVISNAENRGFAAANNQALERATGSHLCLLNNDTVVPRGWLARLIRTLDADPSIGLIGPVTNGVWNEALVDGVQVAPDQLEAFAARWAREHAGAVYPIGMLAMYCVVAPRSVIDAVGTLDERFGIGMFEDDDYAHRIRRAGWRLACAEEVFVHHAGQASFDKLQSKKALWEENRAKFESKWGARWRPPSFGTRARTLEHRRELARNLGPRPAKAPVILLAAPGGPSSAMQELVDQLATRGHPVIDVREPGLDSGEPSLERDGLRLRSTLPLEAFDEITGAIVLPSALRAFDAAFFRSPTTVYVDEPEANPEARRDLLARADLVVGDATEGAIPPTALDDVVTRLLQPETAST